MTTLDLTSGPEHSISQGENMQAATILIFSVSLLAFSSFLAGDEIYRSVDAEGNVTYSDTPPAGGSESEVVELPPGPSPDAIKESTERNLEIRRAATQAQQRRLDQEQGQGDALSEARKALQDAEARLEEAKVIRDEDRQKLAGGMRRIRPDYFERVKAAEAEVEAARKRLREARGR